MSTDFKNLPIGLYVIYWKDEYSGGTSLASVGRTFSGKRWFSPSNWTASDGDNPLVASTDWELVAKVKRIEVDIEPN